jgi:predicted phage baseplate assembly protein
MSLLDVKLDDRDFQSLVDEARRRIVATCPEWTEHNLSDPGITLIELFAWMTDVLLYRVNRIPEKLQRALMELLQISLTPPREAKGDLLFLLAPDQKAAVTIPAGTAVASDDGKTHQAIVFTTSTTVVVPVLRLAAMVLLRGGHETTIPVVDGTARPVSADRPVFSTPPGADEAMLLGFERPIGRLVIDVAVSAIVARGTGVEPGDPPLRWEASATDGSWLPVAVLSEKTGGLNLAEGVVRLQIPADEGAATFAGRSLHWLRCRIADPDPDDPAYVAPPKVVTLSAAAAGALVPASHSQRVDEEFLGHSDGTPGQAFTVHRHPALPLERDDETLEVRDAGTGDWVAWAEQESLAGSGPLDQHFRFDAVTGGVELGPAVRVTGGWKQYGATPPAGAALRLRAYRFGGGATGNLAGGALTNLRDAIPGVASVSNPRRTSGGVDAETIDDARLHAARRLRTHGRAVTAGDYEAIVEQACPRVARARCGAPRPGQALPLYVLPEVSRRRARHELEVLAAQPSLLEEVAGVVKAAAVLGASVHVTPVPVRVVTVAVEVEVVSERRRATVEQAVADALYAYVNPYVGGRLKAGWEWGRSLHAGELAPVVRDVAGVHGVTFVRVYEVDVVSGRPGLRPLPDGLQLEPHELLASGIHQVHAVEPS